MKWSEINLKTGEWKLEGARTKTGFDEIKMLSRMAIDLLPPRRNTGDYVFGGHRPMTGFTECKEKIDALCPELKHWTLHDLRRTFRTNLGMLKVPFDVAELCLGHAQQGVSSTYDLYTYIPEKRKAVEKWAARVRKIVSVRPPRRPEPRLKLAS
jgi:integrase